MVSYSASPRNAARARASVNREQRRCPPTAAMRATRTALRLFRSQPVRILRVTGTSTAPTTASRMRRDQRLVLQQRGAGGDVADLLGRAAHVDVDDLGALRRRCSCAASAIIAGSAPGDLDRDRLDLALVVGAAAASSACPTGVDCSPPSRTPPCLRPVVCKTGGTGGRSLLP